MWIVKFFKFGVLNNLTVVGPPWLTAPMENCAKVHRSHILETCNAIGQADTRSVVKASSNSEVLNPVDIRSVTGFSLYL